MTNLQLVLTIGIPSLLVILSWINANKRMDRMEQVMDQRFAQFDARFTQIDNHLARIDADLRQFYHLTGKLEGRVEALEKQQ